MSYLANLLSSAKASAQSGWNKINQLGTGGAHDPLRDYYPQTEGKLGKYRVQRDSSPAECNGDSRSGATSIGYSLKSHQGGHWTANLNDANTPRNIAFRTESCQRDGVPKAYTCVDGYATSEINSGIDNVLQYPAGGANGQVFPAIPPRPVDKGWSNCGCSVGINPPVFLGWDSFATICTQFAQTHTLPPTTAPQPTTQASTQASTQATTQATTEATTEPPTEEATEPPIEETPTEATPNATTNHTVTASEAIPTNQTALDVLNNSSVFKNATVDHSSKWLAPSYSLAALAQSASSSSPCTNDVLAPTSTLELITPSNEPGLKPHAVMTGILLAPPALAGIMVGVVGFGAILGGSALAYYAYHKWSTHHALHAFKVQAHMSNDDVFEPAV